MRLYLHRLILAFAASVLSLIVPVLAQSAGGTDLRSDAVEALHLAAGYYHSRVASHGGYVYFYTTDLRQRWGEGEATSDQIWVQPPGTPTVGMAYLDAYEATSDRFFLEAATDAAVALVQGQLKSGGWTNCIDFDPRGERVADYRHRPSGGKSHSSLDDGQTQSALRFLIRADKAHDFKHEQIHECVAFALDALLNAQFPNGGFPQVWTGPVEDRSVVSARFPKDDLRSVERIKNYWDMYTLNDNVCGYTAETLIEAYETYDDTRYLEALRSLGDFLMLAQMPGRQPAWAQQYDVQMRPIWARRFEPPAIASDETQEAIATLLDIAEITGDRKYLKAIPRALAYLESAKLSDGTLARYYELRTNRPLYMVRNGRDYAPTYSDKELPGHYAWKVHPRIDELRDRYALVVRGNSSKMHAVSVPDVRRVIDELDEQGRWVSIYAGEQLVGQPKFPMDAEYLSSERFSRNLSLLSQYLAESDAEQ